MIAKKLKHFFWSLVVLALTGGLILIQIRLSTLSQQQELNRLTEQMLDQWSQGEILPTFPLWQDPQQIPPFSSIKNYHITRMIFNKKSAKISVHLELPQTSPVSSQTQWTFELKKTPLGWLFVGMY